MALSKKIEVGGIEVTVRELTVSQVRDWIKSALHDTGDAVDWLLMDGISLHDVKRMCDLTDSALDALTPSEVRFVCDAIREVNPDFFALRGRLKLLAERTPATLRSSSLASSSEATPTPGITRGAHS